LIGDLRALGLHMELRSGAKVAHCRPCGQDCFQVGLDLIWSDLDVQRPGDSQPISPSWKASRS
jgi:hypothetical protein